MKEMHFLQRKLKENTYSAVIEKKTKINKCKILNYLKLSR